MVFLYLRELPGGGLVTIETTSTAGPVVQCRLAVERRGDARRRDGHAPPVIAEASAPTQALAFRELYGIAADNVAVARGLLVWQAHRSAPPVDDPPTRFPSSPSAGGAADTRP